MIPGIWNKYFYCSTKKWHTPGCFGKHDIILFLFYLALQMWPVTKNLESPEASVCRIVWNAIPTNLERSEDLGSWDQQSDTRFTASGHMCRGEKVCWNVLPRLVIYHATTSVTFHQYNLVQHNEWGKAGGPKECAIIHNSSCPCLCFSPHSPTSVWMLPFYL